MEGRPELDHALKSGSRVELAAFCAAYINESEVRKLVGDEVHLIQLDKALFDDLAFQRVPNNFILVLEAWNHVLHDLDPTKHTVVLEGLEKPGNLGAILRTCDAAGFDQVIISDSEIDLFNPNVLRNSRGAAFSIKCVFTTNDDTLAWLQKHEYTILSAAIRKDAVPLKNLKTTDRNALVFGAESKGLTDFWIENADQTFIIPMKGKVDSLNLSVSVGIVLYLDLWN